jgi:hypothetical protein
MAVTKMDGTLAASKGIMRVRYSHDAMIDEIIAAPHITQRELAARFGYTEPWISQVINSDAFRERLAERKDEIVDPRLRMAVDERLRALVDKSLEVLLVKLEATQNMNVAIRALDVSTRALGYGVKNSAPVTNVNNYVAFVPNKSPNGAAWAEAYTPAAPPKVIENE